jgi:hypothetical protein
LEAGICRADHIIGSRKTGSFGLKINVITQKEKRENRNGHILISENTLQLH